MDFRGRSKKKGNKNRKNKFKKIKELCMFYHQLIENTKRALLYYCTVIENTSI